MIRRYSPMKASAGTRWPDDVRRDAERLDGHRCVCERAGFPAEVVARCGGDLQLDHVRASHGIGMKSESTVANAATLSAFCHAWKTEHGRQARPLLLDYIERRSGSCSHVDPVWGCTGGCNRADPMQLSATGR
jgi:hypothetical protein